MQKNLLSFFKRTDSYELPTQWASDMSPKQQSHKRPVGRPRKKPRVSVQLDDGQSSSNTDQLCIVPAAATDADVTEHHSDIEQTNDDQSSSGTDLLNVATAVESDVEDHIGMETSTDMPALNSDVDSWTPSSPLPASPATGSKPRGKYKAYSVAEKEEIVREARERGVRVTSRDRRVAIATLIGWMKSHKLDEVQAKNKRGARIAGGGRKLVTGEKDELILKWILEQRELHIPVSRQAIQDYAKRLCETSNPEFVASSGWLDKFMKRHELSLRSRTSMSQKLPADLEDKVSSFYKYVKDKRIEDDYEDKFIVNMDETPVFFDLVPNKTVETQGKKSVIVRTSGSDKRHVTVMLAVSASGDVLPTFVIFKGKRPLKDIKAPKDVTVLVQQKAWVDESVMLRWVDDSLRAYTNRNRTLLVMDSFRCHLMDSIKKRLRKANAETAIIPGQSRAVEMGCKKSTF